MTESGAIALPAESTLQSYAAYNKIDYGVEHDSINLLSKQLENRNRDVVLLQDEMKIKDKLIYDRNTGKMTGFVMLDGVTNALGDLLDEKRGSTATHAVCFMARAVKSKVSLPVGHYCTSGLTAEQIYNMFW